tara:strand:+ start:626 stop:1348 length:723 start_codon:yes stop_codon:yes gene_type:complete
MSYRKSRKDILVSKPLNPPTGEQPIKFGDTPTEKGNSEFTVQPAKPHKPHRKSSLSIPAYHVRCPWFSELPINDLREGESIAIPFTKFESDPRIANKSHTTAVIELMRSNLRQFFEKEFPTVNHRLGTRVIKTRKTIIVFRRYEADLLQKVDTSHHEDASGGEFVRARAAKTGKQTAKDLVRGASADEEQKLLANRRYADRRPTITDENVARLREFIADADTTATAVVNEILEAFFEGRK